MPKLTLRADRANTMRGRPWIFSNDLQKADKALTAGSVVHIADPHGRLLGTYHYNPHTLIAARLLSRNPERLPDSGFFQQRLETALALRSKLFDAPHYRLVHAEGDDLPGLIIDRYGDTLVVQPNTAGMTAALPLLIAVLQRLLSPSAIVVQADSPSRTLEGLEPISEIHGTLPDGPLLIEENGLTYEGAPLTGQKTGWFFDHRLNRAFTAQLAKGRTLLDVYSYTGAFALAAAHAGATHVTAVDRSSAALELAQSAAARNGLDDRFTAHTSEAFDWLEKATDRFDVVVADPPAFAKSHKDVAVALKAYAKLARLAAARVNPGGFLCLASCSHHITPDAFLSTTSHGIRTAGRSARLIHTGAAGPDHPVHPQLPQTAYLKFLVFALD